MRSNAALDLDIFVSVVKVMSALPSVITLRLGLLRLLLFWPLVGEKMQGAHTERLALLPTELCHAHTELREPNLQQDLRRASQSDV